MFDFLNLHKTLLDVINWIRGNKVKVYWVGDVIETSQQMHRQNASITFINKSAVYAAPPDAYPTAITATDVAIVNGIRLDYNDSITFNCNEGEEMNFQYNIQFLSMNNPQLYVHTKYYA